MSESKKKIAHGIEIPQKKLFFFVIFSGISISVAKVFVLGKHFTPFPKLVIIIIIDLLDFINPVLSCSSCLNSCVT